MEADVLGFRGRSELSPRLINIGERNGFVSVAFAFSSLCRFADIGEAEGGLDRECFRSGSGGNESLDSLRGAAAAWYCACASCCWTPKALVFSSSLVLSILPFLMACWILCHARNTKVVSYWSPSRAAPQVAVIHNSY